MTDFIDAWHAKLRSSVREALAQIVALDKLPVPDGVFGDWLDTVCAMRFEDDDLSAIAAIIDKPDPFLQEAGLRLARAASRTLSAEAMIEPSLVLLVGRDDLDPWVLDAIIDLLTETRDSFTSVYQALAKVHGRADGRPRFTGIMRNRAIHPWNRLEHLYQQLVIQTLDPTPRDLAYLPILETKLSTRGWEPTLRHIMAEMGHDPDEYVAMLRRSKR